MTAAASSSEPSACSSTLHSHNRHAVCISKALPCAVLLRAVLQVIRLKGALNEKEMELIELREQHMQLVVRDAAHPPAAGILHCTSSAARIATVQP